VFRPRSAGDESSLSSARRFERGWRINGSAGGTHIEGIKRIPWSSALLTLVWLITVAVGTIGFVIAFLLNEGLSTFGSVLLGIGVTALGVIVLAFGLVIVALAYRLENQRLTQTYEELRQVLVPKASPSS